MTIDYYSLTLSKRQGNKMMTVPHVQCWVLIATYESSMAITTRAWMSNRRAVALAQMLGLHVVDKSDRSAFHLLPDPVDFAETEERRRTFWAVFHNDRWASAGSGHPMSVDEKDVSYYRKSCNGLGSLFSDLYKSAQFGGNIYIQYRRKDAIAF